MPFGIETRYINESGNTIERVLNIGRNKIIILGNPSNSTNAAI